MVGLFCLAGAVFAPHAVAEGLPQYSGPYAADMIWEGEVTMAGDVLILQGSALTIRAGTRVNVVPAEGTKIDPEYLSAMTELLVRGRLDIQGTPEAPVRFVIAATGDQEEIAWAGITLDGASGSRIRHANIDRAETGILCVSSSPEISDSLIVGCRYGIIAQQQSHPRILRNTLRHGEGGVFCWQGSNPYLQENRIVGHGEEALFVDKSSRPVLDRNSITENAIGLAIYPRDLPIAAVTLRDNHENLRWLGHQGQGGGL